MHRRSRQRWSWRVAVTAALAASSLAGCGTTALQRSTSTTPLPSAQEVFEVSGRLSARHGTQALAANFQWRHTAGGDELELSSPLGQIIAMLTGDDSGARLQSADGRVLSADSWTRLTEAGLGWPLPVDGLRYWIQGSARAEAPFTVEDGDDGRASVLRQDGWTIVYQSYVQTTDGVWRPSRMTASYPEVELRLAIDQWH